MRPGSMRVAWDRIIPQTNLTQDAIEGFASGNPELDHFWLDKSLTYSKIGMCAVHVAMKGEDIAGFYTISPSVIRGVGLPKSRQAGKPTMAHPSWLIGELAVRKDLRGKKGKRECRRGLAVSCGPHGMRSERDGRRQTGHARPSERHVGQMV